MPFTPEQRKRITDALDQRLGPGPLKCPLCTFDALSLGDRYAVSGTSRNAHDIDFTRAYMLLPLQCTRCGHTLFLNPLLLGLSDLGPVEDIR